MQTKTTYGGRSEFKCTSKHYSLTGTETRFCQASGTWSGTPVVCNGKTTALRNGPYGIFSYIFRKFPWIFLIPSVLICLFSAPCNNPGIPKGGKRIDNNFRHGKHVRFSCPRNRKMVGPRKITCYNGHWSNKRPQCLRPSQIKGKANYL